MTTIRILRYFGHGKYYDVPTAQKAVEKLRKRHPDREYTIMTNMRSTSSYRKFQVVQLDHMEVDWPTMEDLGLPAKEPELSMFRTQEDYMHEVVKRRNLMQNAVRPIKDRISRKLNP